MIYMQWTWRHYEHDWQRKRTKYTVPQVDKGTSLHCYYVQMCRTGVTCILTFYIIAVKGCSFVYLRNCIFCPLSLSDMFIVRPVWKGEICYENKPGERRDTWARVGARGLKRRRERGEGESEKERERERGGGGGGWWSGFEHREQQEGKRERQVVWGDLGRR